MLLWTSADFSVVITFSLLVLTIALLKKLLIAKRNNVERLPPGPRGLPLIGNMLSVDLEDVHTYRNLRRQYGDYFTLKLGTKSVVVVSGYDNLTKLLKTKSDIFSDRPSSFSEATNHAGLFSSSGEQCRELRSALSTPLKYHSNFVMQTCVEEEIQVFLDKIELHRGEPFDLHHLIKISITNITCRVIFGRYFNHNEKEFQHFTNLLFNGLDFTKSIFLMNFYPALRSLFHNPITARSAISYLEEFLDLVKHKVTEHKDTLDERHIRDVIDDILILQKQKENENLSDKNICSMIRELFLAGVDTTAAVLCWLVLFLLYHPDVQEKSYQEILKIVGKSRLPKIQDQSRFTYITAVITEGLRCGNVAPLAVPHATTEDVSIDSYVIPKGTTIFPSLDSVLFDPNIFPNPEKFIPERFIGKSGKLTGIEKVIAFSLGRRVCVGGGLARMILHVFMTSLLQHFHLDMEDKSNPPSQRGTIGVSHLPPRYKVRAVKRH